MKGASSLLLKTVIAIVLSAAALVLVQMWLDIFPPDIFIKLLVTLGVLGAVAAFIIAVKQDLSSEKKLKDDKFID